MELWRCRVWRCGDVECRDAELQNCENAEMQIDPDHDSTSTYLKIQINTKSLHSWEWIKTFVPTDPMSKIAEIKMNHRVSNNFFHLRPK
jgi:hypothetical protein